MDFFDDYDDEDEDIDLPVPPGLTPPKIATIEELFSRKHRAGLMSAYFTGQMGSYLYGLGYTTGDQVTEVEARMEQLMPTLLEESQEVLKLLQTELCYNMLGGVTRLQICESVDDLKLFEAISQRATELRHVITMRLDLQERINKQWQSDPQGPSNDANG